MSLKIPDVSVVIVTYNSESEIGFCLTGLVSNLPSHSIQVHLIDNASTDGTVQIIENFNSRPIDGLQVLITKNKTNRGFTAALNQGLQQCEGTYVLVLNPDASLREESLSLLITALNKDSEIGVVAPQLFNPDYSIQRSCRRFPRRRDLIFELSGLSYLFPSSSIFNAWKMGGFSHRQKCEVDQSQGACLLFSKKVLQDVGLWDEGFPMFFSDVDWCARVKKCGYKIVFAPEAKVDHKKGASIYRDRSKMIISSHKSFIRYFKKNRPNFILVNHIFAIILWVSAFLRVLLYRMTTFFQGVTLR